MKYYDTIFTNESGDFVITDWENGGLQFDAGTDYDSGSAGLNFEEIVELRNTLSDWIKQQG